MFEPRPDGQTRKVPFEQVDRRAACTYSSGAIRCSAQETLPQAPNSVLLVGRQLVSDRRSAPPKHPVAGHKDLPLGHSDRAALLVGLSIDDVAFRVEMVGEQGMD